METDLKTEEAYWPENHSKQPFAQNRPYSDFAAAYRTGYEGFHKYPGKAYEEIEDELADDYEHAEPGSPLPWDHVRHAVHAAWAKLSSEVSPRDPRRGIRQWV